MTGEPLISVRRARVSFGGEEVLTGVDLTVRPGEIVTLIGPNGAGKTTLVRVALGLQNLDSGEATRRNELTVGYMPQRLQVEDALPMSVRRFLRLGSPNGGDEMGAVLDEVGASTCADKPVQGLSGGEMQRVLLARAILRRPDLLVLDEPVQGVDVAGQTEFYRLLGDIRKARGCGVLMVSHDLHLVMAATDQVICLNRHVCCEGHPESVQQNQAYKDLFGASAAATLAVYHHHHDHHHAVDGHVESGAGEGGDG